MKDQGQIMENDNLSTEGPDIRESTKAFPMCPLAWELKGRESAVWCPRAKKQGNLKKRSGPKRN